MGPGPTLGPIGYHSYGPWTHTPRAVRTYVGPGHSSLERCAWVPARPWGRILPRAHVYGYTVHTPHPPCGPKHILSLYVGPHSQALEIILTLSKVITL